ncbi:retrovirus-related pol polyprotein from transposon TNT 1-94 [Tanacetum coccineum]
MFPSSSISLAVLVQTLPITLLTLDFSPILGYGDLIQGNVTIKRVYYVEGLNHNLFSVGQFCDVIGGIIFTNSNMLHGKCFTNSSMVMAYEAFSSYFDYITLLSKNDVVKAYCSSTYSIEAKLLLMDLCGPMRVGKHNGKKVYLVMLIDYSMITWTLFLTIKMKTPRSSFIKDFLTMIQRNLQAQVITVRTDRGTEFLNKTLHAYFKEEGIEHQTSTPRTPEQNGVVERRNRTLVEAARTMLSASKLPLSFWAEAVATACYTQNRSIIISTHGKTAYHIINDRKPSIKHLHIFGCICYITRDGVKFDKMKEKGDPCVMVGILSVEGISCFQQEEHTL